MDKGYASPAGAARRFNCSRRTIYRKVADGTIPALRIGRVLRIDLDAAEQALGKSSASALEVA